MARKKKKAELCPSCNTPFEEHESLEKCFTDFVGVDVPKSDAELVNMSFLYLPVKKIRQEHRKFKFLIEGEPEIETDNPRYELLKLIMQNKEKSTPEEDPEVDKDE